MFSSQLALWASAVILPVLFSLSPSMQQIPHILAISPNTGPPGTVVTLIDVNRTMTGKMCYAQIAGRDMRIDTISTTLEYVVPANLSPQTQIIFYCTGGADGRSSNPAVYVVTAPEEPPPPPTEPPPPPVEQPSPTEAPPEPPQIVLPQLPASGDCVVATREATSVNVREGPSLDAPIVGQLDPSQIYEAAGRDGHNDWIELISFNPGWVSVSVIRLGGDCSLLPQTDNGSRDDDPAVLLLPAIQKVQDADTRMENCPEYLPALDAMPMYLTLFIVGDDDPCAAAASEIDDLFFGPPPVSMQEMEQCPEDQPGWDVYWKLRARTFGTPTRDYLDSLPDILPDHVFCLLLWDLSWGIINEGTFPADEHVMPVALAYCDNIQGFGLAAIHLKLEALDMPVKGLRGLDQNCILFDHLRPLGSVNVNNVNFFNMVVANCGVLTGDVSQRAFSDAIRGALDPVAAAAQGCAGMQLLDSHPLPAGLQPMLPQITDGDATCTGRFRMLATHNSELGLRTLYRILKSADPCQAAHDYAYEGKVPVYFVSPPSCIQGEQLILQGGAQFDQTVLDASSPWYMKIMALDRPFDEICLSTPQLDPAGDLAIIPTLTLGALVAAATPTPGILVIQPSPTPDIIVAVPTSESDMPEAAEPEVEPPTPLPPQDEGILPTPSDDPQEVEIDPHYHDMTGCFGCLPANPLIPGGQAQIVVVASDLEGGFAGLWAAPVHLPPGDTSDEEPNPDDRRRELVHLPLTGLPEPLADYPAILSPDGTLIGFFAHGIDPESLPASTQKVLIVLTDGVGASEIPGEHISFNFAKISPDIPVDGLLPLTKSLFFPEELSPAPYAPVWTDEDTIILTLADSTGMESLYLLQLDDSSETLMPQLLVMNASAPSLAPNGRYLAFERSDESGRNIYAMALNSALENPITQQRPGAECYGANFGPTSLTIYFTCRVDDQRQMYAYGLNGVAPINTDIPNAQHPKASNASGFIYFDDGQMIYLGTEDGTRVQPYLNIELENVLITSYHFP